MEVEDGDEEREMDEEAENVVCLEDGVQEPLVVGVVQRVGEDKVVSSLPEVVEVDLGFQEVAHNLNHVIIVENPEKNRTPIFLSRRSISV